jgi:hypothetical protein
LDYYPSINRREFKNIDAKFQVELGYWAFSNHLQDYKINRTMIKNKLPGVSKQLVTTS